MIEPTAGDPSQPGSLEPTYKVGDLVSPRAKPGVLLPVMAVIPGGAEQSYRVFENNAKVTYYESQLQAASVPSDERQVLTVQLHSAFPTFSRCDNPRAKVLREIAKHVKEKRVQLLAEWEANVNK